MRITGGLYRGRILAAPPGRDVRPTGDKVRLALFNILNGRGLPDGITVIDAFCGTGALGLEALSRGAAACAFLDNGRASLEACRRNIAALKIPEEQALVLNRDMTRPGARPESFAPAALVFLDPPYRRELGAPALSGLAAGGWIAPGALCVCEEAKDAPAPAPDAFETGNSRDYGDTRLHFLTYRP